MKRLITLLGAAVALLTVHAQTLNVVVGEVTYQIPATQAGEMVYSGGTKLTILNKTFLLSDINYMYFDNSKVTDNTVSVTYSGSTASIRVAGNCMQYIDVKASGADVVLLQHEDLPQEITYQLSGTTTDGSLYMDGTYKATFILNGLCMTNPDSAAVNIRCGKRIAIELADGTDNSLTDGKNGKQKAALMVNGHTEFKGGGKLTLTGNTKHAFWGDEYVELKKSTGVINVAKAVKDGFSINQYLAQKGGTIVINHTGDDGIQVERTANSSDEQNGQIIISGGSMDINVTAAAAKALTAESSVTISGGTLMLRTAGGGKWDETNKKTKAASCISSDGAVTISGGTIDLTSTGHGGKGISCNAALNITDGKLTISTSGNKVAYINGTFYDGYTGNTDRLGSNYKSSPKGMKADGDVNISGGTITVTVSGNSGEGIESKQTMTISGGKLTVNATDDAINCKNNLYLKGGNITAVSSGNDGLDANKNIYLQGATVAAYGARAPECGIDAAEGYQIYFSNGTLLSVGGSSATPSSAASTQPYVQTRGNVTAGNTIIVKDGDTTLASFVVPTTYSNNASSGWGGYPGGYGNGSAYILVTCSGLSKGHSYTVFNGSSTSSATAAQYGKNGW